SHAARFWVSDDGIVAATNVNRGEARLLEDLDDYFAAQTGCRVSRTGLRHFPTAEGWQTLDHRQRRMIEAELVELCTWDRAPWARPHSPTPRSPRRKASAADHVLGAFRAERPIDMAWLRDYYATGGASYDDLLALAFLEHTYPDRYTRLIRDCVSYAVADTS